ncbi:MAG: IS6 family transposase [Liquorilactobacillus hordei]|uniref:IS6 family transposase n=2 Tax=Lactobacillales TaxID=186826 RepID=UPI001CC1F74B|nr:IS6 family transposase [Lentilactobacillus hilgardii]MBZ2202276.1 IS6 family transposase [Lentilactobacillus hilgardii]MBZ2205284.1 IS6 family transposase [Lentilactobacillus hilgardii]
MKNYFKGRHFQKDIILVAIGYYFRFSLSYRDLVEILRDRGIAVHHTTIMRWVHHYGPIFKWLWRKHQHAASQSWRMDETYLKIKGRWYYFYRAIDSHGLTLDFELRQHRDYLSAYHFLKRLLTTYGRPNCLVTDQYGGTLKAIKQVIKDGLLTEKNHQCSKYRNNLIEQDHRLIKRVLVKSSGFQSLRTALKTLSGIEVVHQLHKISQREPNLFGFSVFQSLAELLAN